MSIPADLIHEIRTHFRGRSGLPNYDQSLLTTTSLPSVEESISNFCISSDSTDNVRCKSCKGKLLRGASSVICVYCGEEQFSVREEENNVTLPDSLKFKETAGFNWLLDALKLDGSETVGSLVEEIQLHSGKASNKNEVLLSDLLDLEIKWERDQRRDATYFRNNSTTQNKLSLAEVNINSFFTDANKDPILSASGDGFGANPQKQSIESHPLEINGSVNLFENFETAETSVQSFENVQIAERSVTSIENVQPSQASIRSTEGEIIDRFSGWEAEFQSTSLAQEGSNPVGAFGSSEVDLSMHIDAVFGSEKDLENKLTSDSAANAPMANAWDEDDVWSNFNSGVSSDQATTSTFQDGSSQDQVNTPIINDDLIEGLQRQPSSSKVPNDDAIDVSDDAFDDWNDFASSRTSGQPYSSAPAQNFDQTLSSSKQSEEVNLFISGNTFSNMGGGNSVNTDFFSNSIGDSDNLLKFNDLMSNPSLSIRSTSVYEEKPSQQDGKLEDNAGATSGSKVDYIEMLMSQMHDLSFMLESDLSLPKR